MQARYGSLFSSLAAALLAVAMLVPVTAQAAETRNAGALSPVTFRSETAKNGVPKRLITPSERDAVLRGNVRRSELTAMPRPQTKVFADSDFIITEDDLDVENPRIAVGSDAYFIAAQWAFSETDRDVVCLIVPFDETEPIVSINVDATAGVDSYLPAVAYSPDAGVFLMVWEDFEGTVSNIYGAFVDEAGVKLTDSFLIVGTQEEEFSPSVAYAGFGDFVVFYGATADYSLQTGSIATYATRVNFAANGDITLGEEALVADNAAFPRATQIDDETVVVAYQTLYERTGGPVSSWDWDTAVRLVDFDGVPLGQVRALSETAAAETYPSVAYNPQDRKIVVAYEYAEGAGTDRDIDIAVVPLNNSGALGTPQVANVFDSPNFDGWTDIAWDGVNDAFLLAWQHDFDDLDGDIYALELDRNGVPVGDVQVAIETEADTLVPAVGALNGFFLVAWQELIGNSFDLVGRFYEAGTTPPPPPPGNGRIFSIPLDLVPANGTLEVPVELDNASGVLSFRVAVCYPGELNFTSARAGGLNGGWSVEANDTNGSVVVSGSGASALNGSGSVAVLRFTVPDSSNGGDLTFCEPSLNKLNDGQIGLGTPLPGSYLAATQPFVWGDLGTAPGATPAVACDGVAGGLDASLMLRWDVGLATRLVSCPDNTVYNAPNFPPNGDVNADGVLGGLDASLVLRYDAGIIDCFPADSDCDGTGPNKMLKQATGTRMLSLPEDLPLPAVGQTVAVPVTIDDADDILSYRLAVNFPTGRLAFERAELGPLTPDWLGPIVNLQGGTVTLSSSGAQAASGSGRLVVLYFEVVGTSGGTTLNFGGATRLNDGTVPVTTKSGSVTAGGSAFDVSPSGSAEFGVVTPGENASRDFTVRNTGSNTLQGRAQVSGQGFSLVSATNFTLAPNATTIVTVRFSPGFESDFSGTLTLSGATDGIATVALRGSGVAGKVMGCAAGGGSGPKSSNGDLAIIGFTAIALGFYMRRRALA